MPIFLRAIKIIDRGMTNYRQHYKGGDYKLSKILSLDFGIILWDTNNEYQNIHLALDRVDQVSSCLYQACSYANGLQDQQHPVPKCS